MCSHVEEAIVYDVMAFKSRNRQGYLWVGKVVDEFLVRNKFEKACFPGGPRSGRFQASCLIVTRQPPMISTKQVAAFSCWN